MKKNYKMLLIFLVFFAGSQATIQAQTTCNWKSRNPTAFFWDTCSSNSKMVNGYISFNSSKACFKYQWKVNGVNVGGNTTVLNYAVNQNGTYNVCVAVIDTCNKCDTTFCSSRVINCSGGSTGCNWYSRFPDASFWDSCTSPTGKYSLNGFITFGSSKSCFKYQWKVNGANAGTATSMNYGITQNGTYNVCIKIIDTCNNCDTTICESRVITCVGGSPGCNWKSRNPNSYFWDSCNNSAGKYSLNAYISFNSSTSCFKYKWKVNGVIAGDGNVMKYPITQNGTYSVCVSVIDTCNNCDTSFCSTRVITCIPGSSGCNWKSRGLYSYFWDSCNNSTGKYSVNAYVSFGNNTNTSCFKYQWKVNGSYAGNGTVMKYPITQNGTYIVCLSVIDTCKNCDTSFCSTRVITCVGSSNTCNWKSRNPKIQFWDTCNSSTGRFSLNGYVSFSTSDSCLKYKWKVNGVVISEKYWFTYKVSQNGTYTVCLSIIDSCKNCDTTICISRTFTCIGNQGGCNWKKRNATATFKDTCSSNSGNASIYGNMSFGSNTSTKCFKYQWKVNGIVAGTSNFINYPVTKNGTYSICVSVIDSCDKCDTTFCATKVINCLPTGIQTITDESNEILVYPNPTSGSVTISNTQQAGNYILSDVTGKVMETGKITGETQLLDISSYPDGVYFMRVQTDDAVTTRKILLSKP